MCPPPSQIDNARTQPLLDVLKGVPVIRLATTQEPVPDGGEARRRLTHPTAYDSTLFFTRDQRSCTSSSILSLVKHFFLYAEPLDLTRSRAFPAQVRSHVDMALDITTPEKSCTGSTFSPSPIRATNPGTRELDPSILPLPVFFPVACFAPDIRLPSGGQVDDSKP